MLQYVDNFALIADNPQHSLFLHVLTHNNIIIIMMSTGYESSASMISSSSKNKAFYAKIKDPKSAPVRLILERFYE